MTERLIYMKFIRKTISFQSAIFMIISLFSQINVFAADNDITVELDGSKIDFDVEPEIINGRTMVPLRKIFEEIGVSVKWDAETQTVSARKGSKTVTLEINSSEMKVDKGNTDSDGNIIYDTVNLDAPAQIISGRTLVPTRAVSEAFGLGVEWNGDTDTVSITSKSDSDDSWKENKVSVDLDNKTCSGDGAEFDENILNITKGGDYIVSGTLDNGCINVNTDDRVKLRLSGVKITSSGAACIYIENADKAYITAEDETQNYLICENFDKGTVYSKDNLEIKGSGALDITSDAGHGIKASDNLTIENGNITVNAKKDAIHVNDTFKINGGTLTTVSEGDGLVSESIVIINDGSLNIKTTGEPVQNESAQSDENSFRGPGSEKASVEFETSSKGIKADWLLEIHGGKININSSDHAVHCADEIAIDGGSIKINSEYGKGISAHGNLTIDGADTEIDITKSTEGLESKNILTVNDGTVKIVSSDDGINATGGNSGENFGGPGGMPNGSENGDMPARPPEENADMNTDNMPPDGDPGMRGEGGFGKRDFNGKMPDGSGEGRTYKDCLVINGGNIEVYAEDDCLDSNGNLILNGGIIKASLKTGSFAGPFAVLDPDGTITVNEGATLIAACPSGSEGNITASQNTLTVYCTENHISGDKITLKDSNGETVYEYSPKGNYKAVLIISPKLELNGKYTLSAGDETCDVTLTEQNTVVGTADNGGFNRRNFNR